MARFLHYDPWGKSTSQNVGQMLLSGNSDVLTQSWVLISEKIILQKKRQGDYIHINGRK